MTKIILLTFITTFFVIIRSQSNDYFSQGESWSGSHLVITDYTYYYVSSLGDTNVNSEILYNISINRGNDNVGIYESKYLAKSDLGKIYIYTINQLNNTIYDTLLIDYSRTDSILQIHSNWRISRPIVLMDTIYFDGVARKRFYITDACGQSDMQDYVIEGLFDLHLSPFIDGCFEYENTVNCYSSGGKTYCCGFEVGNHFIGNVGNCIIENLNIEETKLVGKQKIKLKTIDELGREIIERSNTILFQVYDDGTIEKVFIVE